MDAIEIDLPPMPSGLTRTLNLPGGKFLTSSEIEAIAHGLAELYGKPVRVRWIKPIIREVDIP